MSAPPCGNAETRYGNLGEIGWFVWNSGNHAHELVHKSPMA